MDGNDKAALAKNISDSVSGLAKFLFCFAWTVTLLSIMLGTALVFDGRNALFLQYGVAIAVLPVCFLIALQNLIKGVKRQLR